MAQSQDASATAIARYPKRKRQIVHYAEPELDDEDFGAEEEPLDDHDLPAAKKQKRPASRPLPKRKIFPFLDLPGEIRNAIYELCLTDPNGICLQSTVKRFRRTVQRVAKLGGFGCRCHYEEGNQPPTLAPQLLSVCKRINNEAGKLLYSHHFHLEDPRALHSFLVAIGPGNAALLRHMTMRMWTSARSRRLLDHVCFTALMPAVNLISFNTHGFMHWRSDGKHLGRQLYRCSFQWMEAVGRAHGRRDAAADIINIQCWGGRELPEEDEKGYRKELRSLLNAR